MCVLRERSDAERHRQALGMYPGLPARAHDYYVLTIMYMTELLDVVRGEVLFALAMPCTAPWDPKSLYLHHSATEAI